MNSDTPHPPSCCRCSSSKRSLLALLWLALAPAATHALPQGTDPGPNTGSTDDGDSGSGSSSSSSSSSSSGDDGSLSRDGMLNLYFLFIAIAVVLLVVALLLLHRRKKRRKALMRNHGQSALAQDIGSGGPAPANNRWLYGRWIMGGGAGGGAGMPRTPEEGLNERGEAPPPYQEPLGGPPQPAYVPPPAGGFYAAAAPPPGPPPGWQGGGGGGGGADGAAGLTIPMRTLSRDTQGNKPPDYSEALTSVDSHHSGGDVGGGGAPPLPTNENATSSTGNLLRQDGNHGQGGAHQR